MHTFHPSGATDILASLKVAEPVTTELDMVLYLQSTTSGKVVSKLSDAKEGRDNETALLLRMKNKWPLRIVKDASLQDIMEYLDEIRIFMPLLSDSQREEIGQRITDYKTRDSKDIPRSEDFTYASIVQLGITPENMISSILQYPAQKPNGVSGEPLDDIDNSAYAAHVFACDYAERFAQTLRIQRNKNTIIESRVSLIEAYNIFNIYWNSPSVKSTIAHIKPGGASLMVKYRELQVLLESFKVVGKAPRKFEKVDTAGQVETLDVDVIEVDEALLAQQKDEIVVSVKKGMILYVQLIKEIKELVPHPAIIASPASTWMIDDGEGPIL